MICDECGLPLGISRGNVWHDGGGISGRYPPYMKGTFFDVDEANHIFDALSELLEYDIGDLVAGGKYHDTKQYMRSMMERMGEASGGKLPPGEDLYRMMLQPTCIWGIARAWNITVKRGEMSLEVENPYSVPLFCGDVAAVADAVEGGGMRAEWEGSRERGTMTVRPADGYSHVERRVDEALYAGGEPAGEELDCERCPACGAPLEVSKLFVWDLDRCLIEERATGARYCFNNTSGIVAVMGLLAAEVEEGLERKMTEMARDYYRDLSGRLGGGWTLEEQLASFPFRGWGAPSREASGGGETAVAVENPYSDILLSGRIWGMEEAGAGDELDMRSERSGGGALRLTFSPARKAAR